LPGYRNRGQYNNGAPLVADFLTNSANKLIERKAGVPEMEWRRLRTLTPQAVQRLDGNYRDCFPLDVGRPPKKMEVEAEAEPAEE
jgi:hypothetical protein